MINILVNGINGKMGQEVVKETLATHTSNEYTIVCGIDRNINKYSNLNVYDDINKIKENVDVIIDFSVPQATLSILEYAKFKKIPIVIATTRIL